MYKKQLMAFRNHDYVGVPIHLQSPRCHGILSPSSHSDLFILQLTIHQSHRAMCSRLLASHSIRGTTNMQRSSPPMHITSYDFLNSDLVQPPDHNQFLSTQDKKFLHHNVPADLYIMSNSSRPNPRRTSKSSSNASPQGGPQILSFPLERRPKATRASLPKVRTGCITCE
jgi:hypothetical protein